MNHAAEKDLNRQAAPAETPRTAPALQRWLPVALLVAAIGWAYWPALQAMADKWSTNPQYSHGYLVPLFAAFLLWYRRDLMPRGNVRLSWWGLLPLAGACAISVVGAYFFFVWLDEIALLIALFGVALLFGGLEGFRWAWPAIAFLVFMLPLPYRLEVDFAQPLQRIATVASTYVLQTIGLPATAHGNVINLDKVKIGVVEACSGLSMLMTFCAFSTAVAIMVRRPWGDRAVVLLSAVPIAVAVNIARIVTTGILHETAGKAWAEDFFHKKAGWLMMPLALVMLWAELWLLAHLFTPVEEVGPVPIDLEGLHVSPTDKKRGGSEEVIGPTMRLARR